MDKTNVSPQYSRILATQSYNPKTVIAGVKFLSLKYSRDDSGEFAELGRFTNGKLLELANFNIAQVSQSLLLPNAIKAFHIHFNQTDLWFVSPQERLLVGLLDTRQDSSTKDKTMRFILGAGIAQLLVIPPGVAHGAANPGNIPVSLTYFTDQQFNPSTPDEHRLPFDLFGFDFWKIKPG